MLAENNKTSKPLNTMTEKKYNPKAIAKTIDVEELYDLDVTIARFILPRLMVFKKHCERTPA